MAMVAAAAAPAKPAVFKNLRRPASGPPVPRFFFGMMYTSQGKTIVDDGEHDLIVAQVIWCTFVARTPHSSKFKHPRGKP
jgi:hypothetical protein